MRIPIETITTENFTMQYFKFGSGGRPFVILPGLSVQSVMDSAAFIENAYAPVAQEFTVYVFDRRDALPPVCTVHDMAHDTALAIRTLGLKDVYLFGASQGGMMAMVIALEHPELVKKLMLGSASARITPQQNAALAHWIRLAKEKDRAGLYTAFAKAIYPEPMFEQYRHTLEMMSRRVTDEELQRFAILAEGTAGFDVLDALPGLACPVLAIGALDDKVLGGATQEIAEALADKPDFESFFYDGFGHAAFDTAPDYKERLLRFCNQ